MRRSYGALCAGIFCFFIASIFIVAGCVKNANAQMTRGCAPCLKWTVPASTNWEVKPTANYGILLNDGAGAQCNLISDGLAFSGGDGRIFQGGGDFAVYDGTPATPGNVLWQSKDVGTTGRLKFPYWESMTDGDTLIIGDGTNNQVTITDGGGGSAPQGYVNAARFVGSQLRATAAGDMQFGGTGLYFSTDIGGAELARLSTAGGGRLGINFIYPHTAGGSLTVEDSSGNDLGLFVDLGTTGRLDINGLQVGCGDGRICNPDAVGDFTELNSGYEERIGDAKTFRWYETNVEILRLGETGGEPVLTPALELNIAGPLRTTDIANFGGSVGVTGYIQPSAGLNLSTGTARAACTAGIRGTIWYETGGAGVADTAAICSKSSLDAYAWRAIATIP